MVYLSEINPNIEHLYSTFFFFTPQKWNQHTYSNFITFFYPPEGNPKSFYFIWSPSHSCYLFSWEKEIGGERTKIIIIKKKESEWSTSFFHFFLERKSGLWMLTFWTKDKIIKFEFRSCIIWSIATPKV